MKKQPFSTGSSSPQKLTCGQFINLAEMPGREALQPRKGCLLRKKKPLLNQGWNSGTMTKPFDLLTRTILAAPDISGVRFWFQSTRSVLQEGSHLWWWQMEPMKEHCKNHCETYTFLPARDGQPKIITPVDQQQAAQWPSEWGKEKHGGNGFSSLIA